MDHKLTRISAVLLLLLLLLGAGPAALADQGSDEPVCSDMRIYFDGLLTGRGYCLSGRAYLPLEDLVDFEKEKERLHKEKDKLTKELARSKGMLSNEKFLNNAKPEKVQEEKDKLAKYEQMMAQVEARLAQMK